MDSKCDKMLARDFQPQSHISQTLKDAELILKEAQRQDLHLPMTLTQAGPIFPTHMLRAQIMLKSVPIVSMAPVSRATSAVAVPSRTSALVPDIGASKKGIPRPVARWASRAISSGAHVVVQTTVGHAEPAPLPSSPNSVSTCSPL
jgi:hypothetical protein